MSPHPSIFISALSKEPAKRAATRRTQTKEKSVAPARFGRRRSMVFLLFVSAGFASIVLPEQRPAHERTTDAHNSIVGTWKGAYFYYPEVVAVSITVRSLSLDRIDGECELSPASSRSFVTVGRAAPTTSKGLTIRWSENSASPRIKPLIRTRIR